MRYQIVRLDWISEEKSMGWAVDSQKGDAGDNRVPGRPSACFTRSTVNAGENTLANEWIRFYKNKFM